MDVRSDAVELIIPKDQNAVELENVSKCYGFRRKKTIIVNSVDLTIKRGEIYGLLGPSGCGKTTLLRLIIGRLKTDSGSVKIFGHRIGSKECEIPGKGVGYMPQETALYNEFTIKETMSYFGHIYGMSTKDINYRTKFLLELLQLSTATAYIKNLSGGQKRRVSFAVSLFQCAPLLILDEPTIGVDPLLRQSIWKHLLTLVRENKVSVILTTHYIDEVRQASVVGLMRNGQILAEDSPENLLSTHQTVSLEDVFVKLCNAADQSPVPKKNKVEESRNNFEMKSKIYHENNTISSTGQNHHIKIENHKKRRFSNFCINPNRTRAVIRKNLLHLIRNIGGLIFQFIVPSVQLAIFCFTLGHKPSDVQVGFINDDIGDSQFGKYFIESIDNKTISLQKYDDIDLALNEVKMNKIWGLIHIPTNFTSALMSRFMFIASSGNEIIEQSKVRVWLDSIDQQILYPLQAELLAATHRFVTAAYKDNGIDPKAADLPISFENQLTADNELKLPDVESYMMFIAPGIIILISYFMALALTNLAFILEKKDGLIERIYVAGVTNLEIIFGFFISQGCVMLIQIALCLSIMILAFNVPCRGPLFWGIAILILQGICGMFQGLFISTIIDDEYLALFFQLACFIPSLMLTGIVWPMEGIIPLFKYIGYLMPQTLAVKAIRGILLRGWGIGEVVVWQGFIATGLWITLFLISTIVVLRFRK